MQPDAFLTFLPTHDLDAADGFYRGVLGLELVRDQGTCRIYRVREGAYVGFCLGSPVIPGQHRVFLTLLVRDVQAAYDELTARGARPSTPVEHVAAFGITRFLVRDPHGYLVEVQRFDQALP
ncbi:MAG: VOC family protein [Truepera sp.]|jgi:predicted enzyme related to lactoylglutathione lyase|nr:VOC family protein [Truepera sp.]